MSTFKDTTIDGKLVNNEPTSTPAGSNNGTILITHGTSGGSSSIVFQSKVNPGSDMGFIQFDDNRGSGGEANKFTIGTSNDADDDLYLSPSGSVFVTSGTLYTNNISCSQINDQCRTNYGFLCKAGTNGGYGNWFNFNWTGSRIDAWVDVTNVRVIACDYRLKENIKPIKPVLDRLCKIDMFDFTYKGVNKNRIGMFAHELQEVFEEYPQLVSGYKDEVDENNEITLQSINNYILDVIIMKAVQQQQTQFQQQQTQFQQQQTIISSLEARLSALENK
jgi:Chaperone of endosialidase